jgi:hypothetical protein
MNTHLVEIAALVTTVSWTAAAMIMEQATHRSGVMVVNTLKVAFGTIYLAILALIINAQVFPHGYALPRLATGGRIWSNRFCDW